MSIKGQSKYTPEERKERHKAAQKRWLEKNQDRLKEYRKQHRKQHAAYMRKWNKKHPKGKAAGYHSIYFRNEVRPSVYAFLEAHEQFDMQELVNRAVQYFISQCTPKDNE